MRELKKPNFIKNKKLVKTTTFLAMLLVATTLLLSSLVTAISIPGNSMNINTAAKPLTGSIKDISPNIKTTSKVPDVSRDMWDVQSIIDVGTISGAQGNAGAEWDGSYFYTNRWASNLIHKYNPDGTLVGAYTIAGVTGLRDLAFDGTYMWGGNGGGTLWKMDFTSWTLLATFTGSFSVRAIAYDTDLDLVYAKAWTDPVYKINPNDGSIVGTFNLVTYTSTYGLAYDGLTSGGPFLWVFDQGGTGDVISQWDIAAGAFTGVTHDAELEFPYPAVGGIAGGLFFTDSFMPGFTTLGALVQTNTGGSDTVICYEMEQTYVFEHDIKVNSIDAPNSGSGAASFTPLVTIENKGNNSENPNVNLKINKIVTSTIMSEGFESWTAAASATFPPAGWAVYNVLGTNTWARYTSYYKIGSYDAYTGYTTAQTQDDWLTTKGVVVGSCDNKFSFWYRSYSTSYAKTIKVWMSSSGNTVADFTGASGTLLATIGPFTTTTYTQYVYDASAFVGQTRYFAVEDVSTSAYYVHLDEFILPDGTRQGFEGILPGWQTEWISGTSTYNEFKCMASATSPTATPHSGGWMLYYYSYMIPVANSARITKLDPMDFTIVSADSFYLNLWLFKSGSYVDKVQIQLSTDRCTWTTVQEITVGGGTGWKQYNIDVSSWSTQPVVYLSILGIPNYTQNTLIDDISITTYSIVAQYDQTKTTSIAAGETKQITFPNWAPVDWQNPATQNVDITYDLEATSLLVDENPSNDYKEKSIVLHYPFLHDIAVVGLNSPAEDGPAQTLPVECTIKNVGQYQECCYQTQVDIGIPGALGAVFLNEPFTVTNWVPMNTKWSKVQTANAGGAIPEYRFYYSPSETGTFRLVSPAINSVGYQAAQLSWKQRVDDYNGQYTLKVETSTDQVNWKTAWSMPGAEVPASTFTTIIGGLGSSFYLAFTFEGYSFNIDYWYVDNVVLQGIDISTIEYTDVQCTIVLNPGESADLAFDDWTPAALALRQSGEISYIAKATQLLPGDTNPANDIGGSYFTLDYWHDVKIKDITSPSLGRSPDVFYAFQGYPTPEQSIWFESTTPGDVTAIGPNTAPDFICAGTWADGAWYVSPYGLGTLYTVDPTTGVMTLIGGSVAGGYTGIAYDDNTGTMYGIAYSTTSDLYTIDIGTGTSTLVGTIGSQLFIDMAIDNDGICYGHDIVSDSIYTIDLSTATPTLVGLTGISCNYAQGMAYDKNNEVLYLAAYTTTGSLYTVDVTTGHATLVGAFEGGIEVDGFAIPYTSGPPGPADVEVWVPLNSDESISGIVQNLGTFVENDLTCYADIYEYYSGPNGSHVWGNSVNDIDLTALGGEDTVNLGNYVFETQGIYNLILDIPLTADVDDFPNNNQMKLGIGCDDTRPTSTHVLSPATPDGCNGWYVSDLTVTVDAADGSEEWQSGVQEIVYKVNGVQKTIPGKHGSFKIEDDGENIAVEYWAVDNVGNEETPHHTFTVDMDQTAPTVSLTYEVTGGNQMTGYEFTFTATATDDMSLMEHVEFFFNNIYQVSVTGPGPVYQWIFVYNPIPKAYIRVDAYDMGCNMDFDEIEDPTPHSNEQTLPQSVTQTLKLNLGR